MSPTPGFGCHLDLMMESATCGVLTLTLHRAISFARTPEQDLAPQDALATALRHLHLRSIKGKTYFSRYILENTQVKIFESIFLLLMARSLLLCL